MIYLFWISILIIFYTYFGYPLIVYLLSLFYKQPLIGKYVYPTVSIIMPVHNEEANIQTKLESLLSLSYPPERLEILVGSDGSTDKTVEILKKMGAVLHLYVKEEREGKPAMLNILVKEAKGEIIIFTDGRQRLDKNSIKELVKYFSDPKVGSVSAELHFEGQNTQSGNGLGLYWDYEKLIRKSESKIGSMLGATGALYAIRKELFSELPKNLILDDVYIPMRIVQKGYRAIFDKRAKIYDRYPKNAKEEFLRKSRTLAGNFQLFIYLKWLLNPFRSPVAWQFISHKFLRLTVPFLLSALLISNFVLWDSGYFYRAAFILQIVLYASALLGLIFKRKSRLFDVAYMFCVLNSAAVVGLYKFIAKKQDVLWDRAEERV